MSRTNVEVVRHALAAFAAGDRDRMIAIADPDIVIDANRNALNPGIHKGVEGLRRMLAEMDETWEAMRFESLEFIDAGEHVVVVGQLFGKGRGSGVSVSRPNGQVWTVRDGRVVRVEYGFTSRSEALEAAGLAQ